MKPYNCYSIMVYEKDWGNDDETLQLLFYYGIRKVLG